jgi:hypothetical protein
MTRSTAVAATLALVGALLAAALPALSQTDAEPGLDKFGGYTSLPVPGGGTGFFRVAKVGKRWVFVTPQGHAFWLRSVYNAAETFIEPAVIKKKYAGNIEAWATQRNRRLLAWGFNALGEYTSTRGLPVGTRGGQAGNAVPLPFILILNTAQDSMAPSPALGLPEPLKDIVRGVPPGSYTGYRAPLGDFFAPLFATAVDKEVAYWSTAITGGFADKPWVVGITTDDADSLFGFKSRSGNVFRAYPHPAFFIATAKFLYSPAEHPQGRAWQDPKLHSKYAWIAFLKDKYGGSIAALNAAWGTRGFYTAFDDAGGYGIGTGVIDEDGRHTAWVGQMRDNFDNPGHSPGFKADLDAFLYQFARKYAAVSVAAVRAVDKNHLIFGPAALNNYGVRALDQVLTGLADGGIDVFQWNYDPRTGDMSENNQSYDLVAKPAFIWYTVTANADSPRGKAKPFSGAPDVPTQQTRGQHYARDLMNFLNARGANGDHYVVGIDWWELVDTTRADETANMGLITRKDNAYDGKEAVTGAGTDPWGHETGGEDRNYGDFLSSVAKANRQVYDVLQSGWSGAVTGPRR